MREIRAVLDAVQHEAWISREWESDGMTWVIVARERAAGIVAVGAFLVDAWCLGVKDAFADEMTRAELQEFVDAQLPADDREALAPADAKRFIEGAVDYAQRFGFLPHRDFRKARKVLNGISDAATEAGAGRHFVFGREGKPCFMVGPDDDDARVNRVLAVLTAKFGDDGFIFVDPAAEMEADMAAIEALFVFVESDRCPDHTLSGFVVEGFVAAALLAPGERGASEWWLELWGGTAPEFADETTGESVVEGWHCLWDDVGGALADGQFHPSLPGMDEPEHRAEAAGFCRGFLRGCERWPALAEGQKTDPAAASQLTTLRRLAGPPGAGESSAAGRRDLAPVIAAAIRVLHDAMAAGRPGED